MVFKKPAAHKVNRKLHLVKSGSTGASGTNAHMPKKGSKAEVVNIDKKINEAIQVRLGKFVKEIQELKKQQKKLEAFQKAKVALTTPKKKKKNKGHSSPPKKKK